MLFLRTFGGLSLENRVRPIGGAATQRARLAILAVLAAAGDNGVSRDRLLSMFWSESDADRARGALNQALYALRRNIGEEHLTVGTTDLRLNPEVIASDACEFERAILAGELEVAAGLYTGPFLDGIHLRDTPEFDRWQDRERDRYSRAYASVLERLAKAARDRGDPHAAVDWMRRLAAADPLSSRVARSLMETLVASGESEAAIQHGIAHVALVRDELGVDPEPTVMNLIQDLRSTRRPDAVNRIATNASTLVRESPPILAPTTARSDNQAPKPVPIRRTRSFLPSHKLQVTAAVAGLGLVSWLVASRHEVARPIVTGSLKQIAMGQIAEIDPAISPDGKLVAFAASRRDEARVGRNVMRVYVQQTSGGRAIPITNDSTVDERAPAWSPDGLRIAFQSPQGILVVAALGGTAELLVADSGREVRTPAWSHDGKWLAYADTEGIWIRDLVRGSSRLVTPAGFGARSPTWSPDDATLAFVVGTGGVGNIAPNILWVVPVTGGAPARVSDETHLNTSPVFTRDGGSLLYVSNRDGGRDIYQQRLRNRTMPVGAPIRVTTGANAVSLSLSADGRELLYGALTMRSNIWSAPILANMASPPSSWRQLTSGDEEVECLTVSRDGRWLVYDSNRSGNQDIYKMPAGGGDPVQLTTDRADDFCGTMSPDGREILFYSFRLGANRREFTMLADGSRQQPVLNDSTGQHWAGDWSPNGNEIAFTSARTGARYTTIAARTDKGGWAVQREILELRPSNVSWSPDGRFLASVTDSGVTLFPAAGGTPRIVVPAEQMGNLGSCYAVWGPDPTILYYRTTNARGDASFWSIPIIGGAARLLLRLNLPAHASRHNAFGSDGTRLFFTMANDEASIWLLDLGYGAR